jgi:UDP-glucose 4-epimerase
MKILLTGGAGFIGSVIARKLIDQGHTLTIIDNLSSGINTNIPNEAEFIHGDIASLTTIKKLNNKFYDAILHIAGQSSGEISFEDPINDLNSNTVSTLRLLNYAVSSGCKRFIYASTMSVYGEKKGKEQFSEDDVVCPKSFYAVGKLASENYLKIYKNEYGINFTSLRYFNVYGPGQNLDNLKQGMVSIYLKQFIDDKYKKVEIKGSLDRFRDLSYVGDVADVTIESINNKEFYNDIYNIGSGVKTTVREIIDSIKTILKSSKEIVVSKGTPGDQYGIYANNHKLRKVYEKDFVSFKKGIKIMIEEVNDFS